VILESYFDDSSDERGHSYCAYGGLIGGPNQWDACEIQWSHETHDLKEPFHSTDCETGHGQFGQWPKKDRDVLMAKLVTILRLTQLRGFASVVPIREYRNAFPACRNHDPYLLAVRHVIMNTAYIAHELRLDVRLWFEKGAMDAAILRDFKSIVAWNQWAPASRLRDIKFETKTLRPLQSADLIAREAFKHLDNLGVRPTRKPVVKMESQLYFVAWNEKALKYLANSGGPNNLEVLANWDKIKDAPRLGPIQV
jgi:hypothetical protein